MDEERTTSKSQFVTQKQQKNHGRINYNVSLILNTFLRILALIFCVVGILYILFFVENECYYSIWKTIAIFISIILFVITILFSLFFIVVVCSALNNHFLSGVKLFSFMIIVDCALSASNLFISIMIFIQKTCYLLNHIPEDRLSDSNWAEKIAIKYDVKIAGVIHLLISVLMIIIAMKFAIIKSNYEYRYRKPLI